jgi:hypothetical protein
VPCGHEGEESNLLPSLRGQSRRWREANLEKARARKAAYRAANRVARRAYMADYRASQKDARRLHAREATFAGPPKAAPTMNGRRRTLNPPVGPFTVKFLDAGRQVTRRDAQQRIKVSRRVFRAVIDSDQGFRRKLGLSNGGITP